jgi:hypothetical protein
VGKRWEAAPSVTFRHVAAREKMANVKGFTFFQMKVVKKCPVMLRCVNGSRKKFSDE